MVRKTSFKGRLGGFALGHLCVCAVMVPLVIWLMYPDGVRTAIFCVVGMLLYPLAGFLIAKLRRWDRPNRKIGLWAVLAPALVVCLLFGVGLWPQPIMQFGAYYLLSSVFWATPSFFLMLFYWYLSAQSWWLFVLCFVLACALPPALFHLGALLGGKAVDNSKNCDILA